MKTRLLLAAVCILALPMWCSLSKGNSPASSTPFAMVAIAGHTIYGDWCGCDGPGCICNPGEVAAGARPLSDDSSIQPDSRPQDAPQGARVSELDVGAGALLAAVAVLMWIRLLS